MRHAVVDDNERADGRKKGKEERAVASNFVSRHGRGGYEDTPAGITVERYSSNELHHHHEIIHGSPFSL